jgi:minimal PKS ketosynthase (KS/KS alpha)
MKRVAVTGLGVLAPNGITTKDFAHGLWEGRNGIGRTTAFDPKEFASQMAGALPDVELPGKPAQHPEGDDRIVGLSLRAAEEAITGAGLIDGFADPRRTGVVVANAIGGTRFMTEHFPDITKNGAGPIDVQSAHPRLHIAATFNRPSSAIADAYQLGGPALTLATGCTGGNDAIGFAFDAIRRGETDVMIAGSAEAPLTPFVVACFDVIGALSTRNDDPEHASRPFDRHRDGFVLAEGAGLAVLEEWELARQRGAPILGEVLGFGSTTNAFHMTDLTEEGEDLARSFRLALDDARCPDERLGYINAHGSSTPQNDVCETNAIKSVLGEHAYRVPISSIKSMIGHALAAANALEFIACVLAIDEGVLPPTINHVAPGDGCDLDYIPNDARETRIDVAASLSSGFGGIHSTVVVGRPGATHPARGALNA